MTSVAVPTPVSAIARPAAKAWLDVNAPALMAIFVFAIVMWPTALLNDSDTWWHLSAGDWIVAHGTVPHTDPFSWTFAGKPWIAHEWLSEILLSRVFAAAGWPGVMLLTACAAATGVFLLAREVARHLSGLALWLTVLGAAALFSPHLLARPHILVVPVMVAWFTAITRSRTPPWAALPLMMLWANMHGSFIAGIALAVPFAIEAVLAAADRRQSALAWAAFIAAGLICALITPFGVDGLLFPFKLLAMGDTDGIGEWRPLDLGRPQPLLVAVFGFAAVWLMRRPKLSIIRRLLLVASLAAALHQQRQEMLLAILAPLLMAEPLSRALNQAPAPSKTSYWLWFPVAALAAVRLAMPLAAPVNASDPAVALAHLPAGLASQRVFNAYDFGGYLIRAGIPPFIDSRADLYGQAFLDRYADLAQGSPARLKAELDSEHIAWTMLKPGSPMAAAMDHVPGWSKLYGDATAVVHMRTR